MKKFLLAILAVFSLTTKAFSIAPPPPPETSYYTIMNGSFTANIWSNISHVGASCSCTPDASCDINIPANTIIYIQHIVTTSCNIIIGSNSTIIVESGGALIVTGSGGVTGTGNFQIDAGGSADISGDFSVTGSGDVTVNGSLNVGGNATFTTGAGSNVCGSGTISVAGTITGAPDPCFTGVLPVELIEFNAVLNADRVDITWTTASETNNHYFTIERSKEGELWANIAIVNGAGTSNQVLSYMDSDYSPLKGTSFYRLKQTDYDGSSTYSQIVVVHNNDGNTDVTAFPNPADGNSFNLEFTGFGDEEVLVVVRDIQGREYYSHVYFVVSNATIVAIPFENRLASGVYLVVASSDDKFVTRKVTVK